MLDKPIVNLLGLVFFFMVIEMLFEYDLFRPAHMLEFFLMVVFSLVVYYLIVLDPIYDMQHDLLLHIAFLAQPLDVLQFVFKFLYSFLCAILLIDILVLLYLISLAFSLEILDLLLLLFSYFVHVIIFLPDVQEDIMGCNLSIVIYSFRLLP